MTDNGASPAETGLSPTAEPVPVSSASAASIPSAVNFTAVQSALDALTGTNADFGFFYRDDGTKVYSCSIRLLSGSLAYGTGDTVAAAHEVAHHSAPIPRSVRTAA